MDDFDLFWYGWKQEWVFFKKTLWNTLLANGTWSGAGVLGPEAFDAKPFLELLAAEEPAGYGSAWGIVEK